MWCYLHFLIEKLEEKIKEPIKEPSEEPLPMETEEEDPKEEPIKEIKEVKGHFLLTRASVDCWIQFTGNLKSVCCSFR